MAVVMELDGEASLAAATSYRTRRKHREGMDFARLALAKIGPTHQVMFELSVCGAWLDDQQSKAEGKFFADALDLARDVDINLKTRARDNMKWYLSPIEELMPSWRAKWLSFRPPNGWYQGNPCVTRYNSHLLVALRGIPLWHDRRGSHWNPGVPYKSRTFMLDIDPETLDDVCRYELQPPDLPPTQHPHIPLTFEDARIFEWRGELWAVVTIHTQNRAGWPEQWLGRIEGDKLVEARLMQPGGWLQPQKNWMPLVDGDKLRFILWCEPTIILDERGTKVAEAVPTIDCATYRGSTQAIPFEGGWLAVVHIPDRYEGWPRYFQRFVWFNARYELKRVSLPWACPTPEEDTMMRGFQYVMGLCWHPDGQRIVMSYQVQEREAYLATFDAVDVPLREF